MEHLEVMPISSRVVCLNAPYLKSLCVFESLSRTLGCYYNHHRPQVVSCQTTVRLPAPRIVRIRGHASHAHTPCDTPTVRTTIQMGTYLVFYLKDWSEIHKCHLILNGIEKVPKTKVPPKILLERVPDPCIPPSNSEQDKNLTNGSFNNTQGVTHVKETQFSNTRSSDKVFNVNTNGSFNNTQGVTHVKETQFSNTRSSNKVFNVNTNGSFNTKGVTHIKETLFSNTRSSDKVFNINTNGSFNNTQGVTHIKETLFSNTRSSDKVFNVNTLPKPRRPLKNFPIKDKNKSHATMHHKNSNPPQHCKSPSIQNYSPKPQENGMTSDVKKDNRERSSACYSITINMDHSEEITTLLDDDNNEDSEYSSDTSDDLHKVVRKRLSVDITSLVHSCPNNNILVLLLRPAEETQAWQFLSSCMKVTHYSTKALVTDGTGTIKKALTRTRPLYFSKNGNAQRL